MTTASITNASVNNAGPFHQDTVSRDARDHGAEQLRPFLVAMLIVAVSTVTFLAMTGFPH